MKRGLILLLTCAGAAQAAAEADRITMPLIPGRLMSIPGHTRRLAPSYVDEGPVAPSMRMEGLTLFLKPSRNQRTALDQLLIALHDPASDQYHQWLTPEDFAARFAITEADAAKVVTWLEAEGFHVGAVGRARTMVVFDGTAVNVEHTFHAGIHRYRSAGKVHYANSANPQVPAVLADIIGSIGGLDDFLPQRAGHVFPKYTTGGKDYLAPGDLATIYDLVPLQSQGINGFGQKVVIVGESDIQTSDIQSYRSKFSLPAQTITMTLTPSFPDPGQTGAAIEANIDLELAGAVATGAAFNYVYSSNPFNALFYAIDQNLAPVINSSYDVGCDAQESAATMSSYQLMAQQGLAQGITWVNSSGDIGPAGCDEDSANVASEGLATRFPADIPEVTAVGGTEFNEGSGTYWAATNSASGGSALSYIPEKVFNDTSISGLAASGGGASAFFLKPPWQTGPGVPNDGLRDVPDVAMAASAEHDGYVVISSGSSLVLGGTSAAAPVFAGALVLVNHYLTANELQRRPGLGNANTLLYRLAQSAPSAFHDITVGNNLVPCSAGSPDCMNGPIGYMAGPGYDLCTGLGSVDVTLLAFAASVNTTQVSVIEISPNANPVYEQEDADGNDFWSVTLTLKEEGGVAVTLTGFTIDGNSSPLSESFANPAIPAFGSTKTVVMLTGVQVPSTHTFGFTGVDAIGRSWTGQISIPFTGFAQPTSPPFITAVTNAFGGSMVIAPNTWVAIKGTNLAPLTDARTWQAADFTSGLMPTALDGVGVTVNGQSAFLEYISGTQVNILTPSNALPGTVNVELTGGTGKASFTAQTASISPSFFVFDGTHVVAQHLNYSDVGPPTLYPGLTTPATPGEEVVLYANGFGPTSQAIVSGSTIQGGTLATLPVVTIGGVQAQVLYAGLGGVGEFQFNVIIPSSTPDGDIPLIATYNGVSTQSGVVLTVQQ